MKLMVDLIYKNPTSLSHESELIQLYSIFLQNVQIQFDADHLDVISTFKLILNIQSWQNKRNLA